MSKEFKLVVPADFEHMDRNLPTASWYDIYAVKAGEYPIQFVDIDYNEVEPEKAYYVRWMIPATLIESYRVNRLFTASSAHTEHPNTDKMLYGHRYAYEVLKPKDDTIIAYSSFGNKENNWALTIHATIVPA